MKLVLFINKILIRVILLELINLKKKRVLLGMIGGVDSSVAAALLLEKGYEVVGVTLKLRPDKYMVNNSQGGCCSLDDIDDARRVAYKLGIDHIVMNFTDIFSEKVIDYFVKEYNCGRTPNPCIACNQEIKFNAMLNKASTLGFDFIATGHYAKICFDRKINRWLLKKADCKKDQSYVLYGMTQYQLSHTLFPVAGYEKERIREIAKKYDLPVANKPDSQEICFVNDNDHAGFIERYTGKKPLKGNFVDDDNNILGTHKGIINYTIGQRKGLGISLGKHMYVTKINAENNTVTLGEEGKQYVKATIANKLNFIPFDKLESPIHVEAKIRYQAKPSACLVSPIDNDCVKIQFDEPQRSVTPGQAIVFYDGDIVVGGGTIIKSL